MEASGGPCCHQSGGNLRLLQVTGRIKLQPTVASNGIHLGNLQKLGLW